MILDLHHHPDGVGAMPGQRVVYDLERDEARMGAVGVPGPALVWELSEYGGAGALLAADVTLDPDRSWLLRCDRVDFPPGAVAHRHVHPGPGIRCVLHGSLHVEVAGAERAYGPLEAWFEGVDTPVVVRADEHADSAIVRVLLLPAEWAGKRTVRYVDPEDDGKPKLQRVRVYLEEPVAL